MGAKILAVLAICLQQFDASIAGEKHFGMYPDTTTCFEGINEEPSEWEVTSHDNAKKNCSIENAEVPDMYDVRGELYDQASSLGGDWDTTWAKVEEGLRVHPQRTGYNFTINLNGPEHLGLYVWSESGLLEKFSQTHDRLRACKEFGYVIPKADEKEDCKDLDPNHHESMQKMVTCIEEAVKC